MAGLVGHVCAAGFARTGADHALLLAAPRLKSVLRRPVFSVAHAAHCPCSSLRPPAQGFAVARIQVLQCRASVPSVASLLSA